MYMKTILLSFAIVAITLSVNAQEWDNAYYKAIEELDKEEDTLADNYYYIRDKLIEESIKALNKDDFELAELYMDSACEDVLIDGIYNGYLHLYFEDPMSVARGYYYASMVYGQIGRQSSDGNKSWRRKAINSIQLCRAACGELDDPNFVDVKHYILALPFVVDIIASDYLTEGNKYYNSKDYEQAIEMFEKACRYYSRYYYNTRGVAECSYKIAMCYAKIGEMLETPEGEIYSEYKSKWRYEAKWYANLCDERDENNQYNTDYIYETVGKGLFNKSKTLYDNGYYRSAETYADSARKQFVAIGNTELAKRAAAMADNSRQKYQYLNLPSDDKMPYSSWNKYYSIIFDDSNNSNIPETSVMNDNTFVFIFRYEDIVDEWRAGEGYCESYVDNKMADAFNKYCNKTLGIPQSHINVIESVLNDSVNACINKIKDLSHIYNGDLNIVFNMGYDILGFDNHEYYMNQLLDELGKIPTRHTFCIIDKLEIDINCDAPESVSIKIVDNEEDTKKKSNKGTIRIKPVVEDGIHVRETMQGNMVVLTAEDAYWGNNYLSDAITYYLLKKLQQTKGDVTLGELYDYINYNIRRISFEETDEFQTPMILVSPNMESTWRSVKL